MHGRAAELRGADAVRGRHLTADATEDKDMRIARGDVPIPRWGEAEDIGRAVAVLASGAIPYATGTTLFIDGGFNVKRF